MRNISFFETQQQVMDELKFLTTRLGWENLKPGEHLTGVQKAQGLRKGERIRALKQIRVLNTWREPLNRVLTEPDLAVPRIIARHYPDKYHFSGNYQTVWMSKSVLEGFPDMSPEQFVDLFLEINPKVKDRKSGKMVPVTESTPVTRILFDYVE